MTAKNLKIYDANRPASVENRNDIEDSPHMEVNPKVVPEQKKTPQKVDRKKPAWALTEKQAEDLKEEEIDDLLDFAYKLDYEKYIDDFEVKQALAILQNRVTELKKDGKWKEHFVEKWNKKSDPEANMQKENPVQENIETQSVKSAKSKCSQAKSIKSMVDTVKELKEKEKGEKPEWDKSVKAIQ